jgi:hypothetical protein
MIRNYGLFVLMGSKPMVWFGIQKEGGCFWSEEIGDYWETWKKDSTHLLGPCYAFVEDKNGKSAYFMNIPHVFSIVNQFYVQFVQVVGKNFSPVGAARELMRPGRSEFWEKVLDNHYLKGLLLGYGPRNASNFFWAHKNDFILPSNYLFQKDSTSHWRPTISYKDLPLPIMTIYTLSDTVLEQYKLERKAILRELKGKDFPTVVKRWLYRGCEFTPKNREFILE